MNQTEQQGNVVYLDATNFKPSYLANMNLTGLDAHGGYVMVYYAVPYLQLYREDLYEANNIVPTC